MTLYLNQNIEIEKVETRQKTFYYINYTRKLTYVAYES